MIALIAAVSAGGIAGTLLRFATTNWVAAHWPRHFYVGTLAVNLVGCLLIGLLYGLFLHKPLAERHAIARHIREQSESRKQQDGPSEISDVTEDAVVALLAANPGCTLLHGHTHRPARHHYQLAGQPRERWVIQDWHDGIAGYLRLDDSGVSAHPLP
mgnify:CR=1 FL=1